MVLAGRLHPLLVHFPIALVLIAAAAELAAMSSRRPAWHLVALVNARAGAVFAAGAAAAGWLLAHGQGTDPSGALEWHRWLATGATAAAIVAAGSTIGGAHSTRVRWTYRVLLFASAAGIGVAAHIGGALVWGDNFLHL